MDPLEVRSGHRTSEISQSELFRPQGVNTLDTTAIQMRSNNYRWLYVDCIFISRWMNQSVFSLLGGGLLAGMGRRAAKQIITDCRVAHTVKDKAFFSDSSYEFCAEWYLDPGSYTIHHTN